MNDAYKNLFKNIIFFLLIVLALLLISIGLHSCHSAKQTSQSATASATAATVASQDLTAAQRQRLDRTFTIQLDDLEWLFPLPAADGSFIDFDERTDSVGGAVCQKAPSMLGDLRSPARLRASRAIITSAATAEQEEVQTAHLEDSTTRHEAATSQMEKASDTTAVAKPVPPWVYTLAIVVVVSAMAIATRIKK